MNNAEPNNTYEISAFRLASVQGRIDDLQKRAAKLSLAVAIGLEVLRTFDKPTGVSYSYIEDGVKHVYEKTARTVEIRVFGEAPKLNGWSLRGRFDFVSIPGECMTAMVPGFNCPTEFHTVSETRCDACGHAKKRNDTFLIQHDDETYKVVGRSCLKDYLGHVSPQQVAEAATILGEFRDVFEEREREFSGRAPEVYDLAEVLAYTSYSVRKHGWASSQSTNSTKADVSFMLTPNIGRSETDRQQVVAQVSERDYARGVEAAQWLATLENQENDYMRNLEALGRAAVVTPRSLGIAVSALVAFDRERENEIKRRQRAERPMSQHVGTVKKREVFKELTLDMHRTWETAYGVTHLYKFRDDNGNVMVWKASRCQDIAAGDTVSLKATVKEHSEYKGEKQTLITRGVVV